MELIEAKSLSCVVNQVEDQAATGRMVTHATDSTTKKRVGKFAVSGIHIGRNAPFPLPVIPVGSEATEDIGVSEH